MNERTAPIPPEAHRRRGANRGRWRPPAHRVRFCKLASCQVDSGSELAAALEARLGIGVDERTPDDSISLEALECIGLCDIRQAATVDDEPIIGLDSVLQRVDELLASGAGGEET